MEKKTIGTFIAALRKANGMTQKDLAQRLNVSDKTVSRWERDEGAPDLAVIPVIAEIFDVTCDELLRGERKPMEGQTDAAEEGELTKKGERQRRRLLAVSLSNFKTHTFICMGISALGTIAAMAVDLGFLRAILAFFVGAAFFVVSLIVQAVSVNHAFLSVSDNALSAEGTGNFRRSVIRWAERSFGLTAVLSGFTLLPLTLVNDTYVGLRLDSWLALGVVLGAAVGAVFCVVCFFLNASLIKKGVCVLDEKQYARYMHNHRLKRSCTIAMSAVMLLTLLWHIAATTIWGPFSIMEGMTFNDYESFVSYMEQDIPATYYDESGNVSAEPESESGSVSVEPESGPGSETYYDESGNEITKEEALRNTITDSNGNVVCEYVHRNRSVCSIRHSDSDGEMLPITVCTYADLEKAEGKAARRHVLFGAGYVLELAAALGVYFLKRAR